MKWRWWSMPGANALTKRTGGRCRGEEVGTSLNTAVVELVALEAAWRMKKARRAVDLSHDHGMFRLIPAVMCGGGSAAAEQQG